MTREDNVGDRHDKSTTLAGRREVRTSGLETVVGGRPRVERREELEVGELPGEILIDGVREGEKRADASCSIP